MIRLSERDKPVFIMLVGISGSGKALALDTEIPTIDGFKVMDNVCIGDTLFDENGSVCSVTKITAIMQNHKCYKLTFSNDTSVIADEDHQWLTRDYKAKCSETNFSSKEFLRINSGKLRKNDWRNQSNKRSFPKIVTTREIAQTLLAGNEKRLNHSVLVPEAIIGRNIELPIKPYTLGAWLGDGTSVNTGFTCADKDILERIEKDGYIIHNNDQKISFGIFEKNSKYENDGYVLKQKMAKLNLLGNKHIPETYLTSSIEQRMDLLRGLMDTDGYISKNGRCEFCNTNKVLALQTLELLNSLGIRATMNEGRATIYGKDCGPKFRVLFSATTDVFSLPRKLERVSKNKKTEYLKYIYIKKCELVDSVPVRCLEVNSKSHLFLITRAFIPTHNSTWIKEQTSDPNTLVVNPDMIRKELTGNISDQTQNAKVWYVAKQKVLEGLNAGKTVILDATNVDSRSRRDFIKDLPSSVLKAKIFNVDPEEAKRRIKKALESGEDRSAVPSEIVDKQHRKFLNSTPEKLQQEGFELI